MLCSVRSWISRGYNDSLLEKFKFFEKEECKHEKNYYYPSWLNDKSFHSAHRSILLAKNYDWYKQFKWNENPAVKNDKGRWPYIWPV